MNLRINLFNARAQYAYLVCKYIARSRYLNTRSNRNILHLLILLIWIKIYQKCIYVPVWFNSCTRWAKLDIDINMFFVKFVPIKLKTNPILREKYKLCTLKFLINEHASLTIFPFFPPCSPLLDPARLIIFQSFLSLLARHFFC